eukprot:403350987
MLYHTMGNNSGSQTNICADSLQFVKPRHLSTSEELSLTKQSLSDGSESSTTCTSPAGRLSLKIDGMRSVGVKTENSTLTEPSISPFSIYNNITHPINNNEVDNMFSDEEPKNKPEADDYKAMESRILSFFSDNKIEVIDLQDELRQSKILYITREEENDSFFKALSLTRD